MKLSEIRYVLVGYLEVVCVSGITQFPCQLHCREL